MELLDIYDENQNHLGTEDRKIVHEKALWHKTVHCWLYDKEGHIYFQIRKSKEKLYTSASGHIQAGETVKEGFGREVKEELGIDINYENAILVEVNKFILDREEPDGSMFRDRAFANVYVCDFENPIDTFHFDENEVHGLAKLDAKETLELLKKGSGEIKGTIIKPESGVNTAIERMVNFDEFLVNKGENALEKYGKILEKVIDLTK